MWGIEGALAPTRNGLALGNSEHSARARAAGVGEGTCVCLTPPLEKKDADEPLISAAFLWGPSGSGSPLSRDPSALSPRTHRALQPRPPFCGLLWCSTQTPCDSPQERHEMWYGAGLTTDKSTAGGAQRSSCGIRWGLGKRPNALLRWYLNHRNESHR